MAVARDQLLLCFSAQFESCVKAADARHVMLGEVRNMDNKYQSLTSDFRSLKLPTETNSNNIFNIFQQVLKFFLLKLIQALIIFH